MEGRPWWMHPGAEILVYEGAAHGVMVTHAPRLAKDIGERGRRRIYRIMSTGREELKAWVAEPLEQKAICDEMLVKLCADAAREGRRTRGNAQAPARSTRHQACHL